MLLDVNISVLNRFVVMDRFNKLVEDFLCRVFYFYVNVFVKVEIFGYKFSRFFVCFMYGSFVDNFVKENI